MTDGDESACVVVPFLKVGGAAELLQKLAKLLAHAAVPVVFIHTLLVAVEGT